MSYTFATAQGLRSYQEDRYVILSDVRYGGHLLGVFDGHGGDKAAINLSTEGIHIIKDYLKNIQIYPAQAFKNAFKEIGKNLKEYYSGSTSTVAFIPKSMNKAIVAVLGDSPVLAKQKDGGLFIGPDHNVRTNAVEAEAGRSRGGYISNGYLCEPAYGYGLQMSRAFGDYNMRNIISTEPEMVEVEFDSWLLLGTDGIVDPGHSKEQLQKGYWEIANILNNNGTAQDVVDRAVKAKTGDNVTAIVWRVE